MFNHDETREIDSSFYKLTRALGYICSTHLQREGDGKPEHRSEKGIFLQRELLQTKGIMWMLTQVITNNLRSN